METPPATPITRARALRLVGAALVALAARPEALPAMPTRPRPGLAHPDPRPGITSANVLSEEKLTGKRKKVKDAFAAARKRPEIFDGVLCPCGCEQHRSLLVCFETDQPTGCHGCQEAALFVDRHAAKGESLERIRKAMDEEWG